MNYLRKRKNAFVYAFNGLFAAFRREAHFAIHLAAAVLVILSAAWIGVSLNAWLVLLGCITLVFVAELFNTALEKLCDLVEPQKNETVRYIKDISAAAVLLCCLFSVIAGFMILGPPLYRHFF